MKRGVHMMQWLATRPETDIAVVTHSSWLKHLFRAFGQQVAEKDKKSLHRLAGNAEVRSICLSLHRGFYPEGTRTLLSLSCFSSCLVTQSHTSAGYWEGDTFIPIHKSFRRYKYATTTDQVKSMHCTLGDCQQAGQEEE